MPTVYPNPTTGKISGLGARSVRTFPDVGLGRSELPAGCVEWFGPPGGSRLEVDSKHSAPDDQQVSDMEGWERQACLKSQLVICWKVLVGVIL